MALFRAGTSPGGHRTFPNGCHVVEVEIDEATGAVEIVRYHAIEDVGHMINPLLFARSSSSRNTYTFNRCICPPG